MPAWPPPARRPAACPSGSGLAQWRCPAAQCHAGAAPAAGAGPQADPWLTGSHEPSHWHSANATGAGGPSDPWHCRAARAARLPVGPGGAAAARVPPATRFLALSGPGHGPRFHEAEHWWPWHDAMPGLSLTQAPGPAPSGAAAPLRGTVSGHTAVPVAAAAA